MTLKIQEKSPPANHPDLDTIRNNIALTYNAMGEYTKALSWYEKALAIQQKSLPPNHSSMVSTYNNIAVTHHTMSQYSTAFPYYEKALEILHKFDLNSATF
jgi:tetratricopeptide (TPR) repeat protein